MAEHDLIRFLDKVGQLQALVKSLEHDQQRRDQLASCSSHNQVVAIAQAGVLILVGVGEKRLLGLTMPIIYFKHDALLLGKKSHASWLQVRVGNSN
jgi:hypothetical protein